MDIVRIAPGGTRDASSPGVILAVDPGDENDESARTKRALETLLGGKRTKVAGVKPKTVFGLCRRGGWDGVGVRLFVVDVIVGRNVGEALTVAARMQVSSANGTTVAAFFLLPRLTYKRTNSP